MNGWDAVIYFARASKTGLVKIGRTRKLELRLKTLANTFGPIELIDTIETPDAPADECRAHDILRNQQVKGEWFRDVSAADIRKVRRELPKIRAFYEHVRETRGWFPAERIRRKALS